MPNNRLQLLRTLGARASSTSSEVSAPPARAVASAKTPPAAKRATRKSGQSVQAHATGDGAVYSSATPPPFRPGMDRRAFLQTAAAAGVAAFVVPEAVAQRYGPIRGVPVGTLLNDLYSQEPKARTDAFAKLLEVAKRDRPFREDVTKFLLQSEDLAAEQKQRANVELTRDYLVKLCDGAGADETGTLWQIFVQSGDRATRNRALELIALHPERLNPPGDELRFLVSAILENPPPSGTLEVAAKVNERAFAKNSSNSALATDWKNTLAKAAYQAYQSEDRNSPALLRIGEQIKSIPVDAAARWLTDRSLYLPTQNIQMHRMLLEVIGPALPEGQPDVTLPVMRACAGFVREKELRYHASRLLQNTKFDDMDVKVLALTNLARELIAARGDDQSPDAREQIPELQANLEDLSLGWGPPPLVAAIANAELPTTSTLIMALGLTGSLSFNEITPELVNKLLSEVRLATPAAETAIAFLERMPPGMDATRTLKADLAKAREQALLMPSALEAIREWYLTHSRSLTPEDLGNPATDERLKSAGALEKMTGWRAWGVVVPEANGSDRPTLINNFATAAMGSQVPLDPPIVRVLLEAVLNDRTAFAALQLLQAGNLSQGPVLLQLQVLRVMLQQLSMKNSIPDLNEIARRVEGAVANAPQDNARSFVYRYGNLDAYSRIYLLQTMSGGERAQLGIGYQEVAQLVVQLNLPDAIYAALVRDIPGRQGDSSAAAALSIARGNAPDLGRAQNDLLSSLINSLAKPALLLQIVNSRYEQAEIKQTARRMLERTEEVRTPSNNPTPPFVSASDQADVQASINKGSMQPPLMARRLVNQSYLFESADAGPSLGRVLTEIDAPTVVRAAVSVIIHRDPRWPKVPLTARAVRALGDTIVGQPEIAARLIRNVKAADADTAASALLVELVAWCQVREAALGRTRPASLFAEAVREFSSDPSFQQGKAIVGGALRDPIRSAIAGLQ